MLNWPPKLSTKNDEVSTKCFSNARVHVYVCIFILYLDSGRYNVKDEKVLIDASARTASYKTVLSRKIRSYWNLEKLQVKANGVSEGNLS